MRRYLRCGLCGLLLIFAANAACAQEQSPLLASSAWVRAENDGAGSGFVIDVDKKLLVTCRHLVAERTQVDVIFPWYRDGELVADRREYLGNRLRLRELGLLVSGKVLKTSDEYDLTLVQLETLPVGLRAAKLAGSQPLPGDRLRMVGNRLDLDTVFNLSIGQVRATGRLADGYFWRGKKLAENAVAIVAQLPTEEGDSGGPVLNDCGELVGMASALRRQCPLAAVVISAEEIRKFAGLPEQIGKKEASPHPAEIVEALMRATVWVRPTSTDVHLAGVLIDKDLVLTCGKGFTLGDRAGIGFPIHEENRWVGERAAYKDSVALALRGCWRSAEVLAHDADRDLALLRLDSTPAFMHSAHLAAQLPNPGDPLHAMSHPSGLEFAWVYASGAVRQRGSIAVAPGENARRVSTIVCQLPAQSGSPGGPVLNDKGELVGILAAKESTQMVGYAVSFQEIATFLDVARNDQSPRTFDGLVARFEKLPHRMARIAALALARQGEAKRVTGRLLEAKSDCDKALSLDPGCPAARHCRARMLNPELALAELDISAEKGPFDRAVLYYRAELAAKAKDFRKARGDLERIVDANPLDADARQRLVGVLLELNEDAKALAAVSDTLRADAKHMPAMAIDLLAQAESLRKKFPDAPAIPAGWLNKALTAAEKAVGDSAMKGQLAELLKRSAAAKDDAERLALLCGGLKNWK
jgi:S1-C subfamily serine protease